MNAILPRFIFSQEDIITLKDRGIKFQEGSQVIGTYKVPCYKFYNINESELCNELEKHTLLESVNTEAQLNNFAVRMSSVLFLRIRQVGAIKDKDQRIVASCGLMAAVTSLASINVSYANRFVNLIRSVAA